MTYDICLEARLSEEGEAVSEVSRFETFVCMKRECTKCHFMCTVMRYQVSIKYILEVVNVSCTEYAIPACYRLASTAGQIFPVGDTPRP